MRASTSALISLLTVFGTVAPFPAFSEDAPTAIRQLRALNSVTTAGVTIAEYERRVLDAKIIVDRYLAQPDSDVRRRYAIERSIGLYVSAGAAWRYSSTGKNPPKSPLVECPPAAEILTYAQTRAHELKSPRIMVEYIQGSYRTAVSSYWLCAAEWTKTAGGGPDPVWPPPLIP